MTEKRRLVFKVIPWSIGVKQSSKELKDLIGYFEEQGFSCEITTASLDGETKVFLIEVWSSNAEAP